MSVDISERDDTLNAHDHHFRGNNQGLEGMSNSTQPFNTSLLDNLGFEKDQSCCSHAKSASPQSSLVETGNFRADANAPFSCNVMSLLNCAAEESRNDLEHLRDALHHTIQKTYREGIFSFGQKRRRSSYIEERGYEAYYAARWRGHLPLTPMVTIVPNVNPVEVHRPYVPRGNDDAVRSGVESVGF